VALRVAGIFGLLAVVAACGGGGPPLPIEELRDLGQVRADQPTTLTILIQKNPLERTATVEELQAPSAPFALEPGNLPGVVAQGADFALRLILTPTGPGLYETVFRVGFDSQEFIVTASARVEGPGLELVTLAIDFGSVPIGESRMLGVAVRNPNQLTPVELTSLGALPAGFSVAGTLPQILPPGAGTTFQVTYAPATLAVHDTQLVIQHSAGAALRASVKASTGTWVPTIVRDFGSVPLSGGDTAWLEVEVPPHAVSLSFEAIGPGPTQVGLLGLEGPGGRIYENDQATGALLWTPGDEGIFTATVPNSDRADVQLVDGGGTYRVRFYLFQGFATSLDVRAIIRSRPDAINGDGVVDLNVFLAPGLQITDPLGETRLQQIVARTDEIFGQQGLHLGAISYFQLDSSDFDTVTADEFGELLEESATASSVRLNLFFVQTAFGGGVLGVAARVPGPALNGTPMSGVMVDYDFGSANTAGHVTAHELGHYLGLFHTVESFGAHDIIDDTLECPQNGTDATCPDEGADYLMHWKVLQGVFPVLTDGQGHVLRAHPLVSPPTPLAMAALRLALPPGGEVEALPDGWCGTPGCWVK